MGPIVDMSRVVALSRSSVLLSRTAGLGAPFRPFNTVHESARILGTSTSPDRTRILYLSCRSYADYPAHVVMQMPALSPTMEKGNLARWTKKVGERVESGDVIANIETDKSEMSWDVSEEGYLAKVLVEDQTEDIPVGQVVAIICEEEEDISAFESYQPEEKSSAKKEAPKKEEKKEPKQESKKETPKKETPKKEEKKESPAPKKEEKKEEKKKPASASAQKKSAADDQYEDEEPEYTDIPNSNVRKVTAARLSESKQTVPHYYLTTEMNVDKLLQTRQMLNERSQDKYKISVNDFVVKAAALAMHSVPEVNASWNDKAIRRYKQVHINVAVTSDKGLFTPLVANADQKGLKDISNEIKALAAKAKESKLTSEDMKLGTFTISNLGMFQVNNFAAIINPPQACILAVGGVEQKVVLNKGPDASESPLRATQVMTCTLSCDHRVVDGATGAKWLQEFKARMEDPMALLL